MPKFKLTIAYDGTAYEGWQVQKIGTGVQEKVEAALARLFPGDPRLHSSSRTDAGVHALGLVAHFDVPAGTARITPRKLVLAINAHLPPDIRVLAAARAPKSFHARFSARAKQYRYFIWNHPAMNPLLRHQAWHVPRALNAEAMRRAAALFVGRHDFQSFTANPGYARASTERTLFRCDLTRRGPLLTFVIEGNGFLYKMCRGIVGTIVQVGLGKFTIEDVEGMFRKRDRRAAGMTAPAHGLVLWRVMYAPRGRVAEPAAQLEDEE
ncbi:MAG TPA: tRNA pseudouridine(38-40) synthase TruA [Verrucomicrobiota bacterium]|nr:tRNA pseudouridine(38-40) synthase TruA [Verrucomicrobiota bacterium]HOP98606.1 tRNA pseudouridine(38-40) synthase TruA [Verrucomicrobiota bacterium]